MFSQIILVTVKTCINEDLNLVRLAYLIHVFHYSLVELRGEIRPMADCGDKGRGTTVNHQWLRTAHWHGYNIAMSIIGNIFVDGKSTEV